MAEFRNQDLSGSIFDDVMLKGSAFDDVDASDSTFQHVRLKGSSFDDVDASDVTLRNVTLEGAKLRAVGLRRVTMRGVELVDVDIHGEIENVTVNGVDIAPIIQAELDRRHPDRALMRPTDAAGFGVAWDTVERLWAATVEQTRTLDPALLHEPVGGEWSFIQTLRHLAFATECWLLRAIEGDPAPWHALSLPWGEAPPTPGVPNDLDARPDLDTALSLRLDRMGRVRRYVDALTDDILNSMTVPVEAPGWPEPISYPVRQCLLVILNEEWEHRLYAERDLASLASDPEE
jgi:DinB superfamily/Pentapeptide repeats (9 copies)